MAVPSFVTAGAVIGSTGVTTLTTALPASRVNNNVLWSTVYVAAAGLTLAITGAGWAIAAQDNTNGSTAGFAWRIVDGTETAPQWSWTGANNAHGQCQQYTGNLTPNPIGAIGTFSGAASTPATGTGFTSTADNSLAVLLLMVNVNAALPTFTNVAGSGGPATWSSGGYNTIQGSFLGGTGAIYKTGTVGATVFDAVPSSNWKLFYWELKGTGSAPVGEPFVRATQTIQQTLESVSNATNVRATQVIQPTMYSSSIPTNVRATQTIQQTLYSIQTFNPPAAFLADLNNVGQTYITNNTVQQIVSFTPRFNIGNCFINNQYWQPPPGFIRLGGAMRITGAALTSFASCVVYMFKNGVELARYQGLAAVADTLCIGMMVDDLSDGAALYTLRCFAGFSGAQPTISGDPVETNFWGYWIST